MEFLALVEEMSRRGLVWDCNGPETHPLAISAVLGGIYKTAARFPELVVVVDHCGGAVGPQAFEEAGAEAEWQAWIDKLATLPNVHMKVGGLQMVVNGFGLTRAEGREAPVPCEQLAELTFPIYSYVIKSFGASRCMFESNFPVDKYGVSYGTLWNTFKTIATRLGLSTEDKRLLFHDTAVKVYKLKL